MSTWKVKAFHEQEVARLQVELVEQQEYIRARGLLTGPGTTGPAS